MKVLFEIPPLGDNQYRWRVVRINEFNKRLELQTEPGAGWRDCGQLISPAGILVVYIQKLLGIVDPPDVATCDCTEEKICTMCQIRGIPYDDSPKPRRAPDPPEGPSDAVVVEPIPREQEGYYGRFL